MGFVALSFESAAVENLYLYLHLYLYLYTTKKRLRVTFFSAVIGPSSITSVPPSTVLGKTGTL